MLLFRWIQIFGFCVLASACQKKSCFTKKNEFIHQMHLLKGFDTLRVQDQMHVELIPDTQDFVEIVCTENLIERISIEQTKNTLVLQNQNSCEWTRNYTDSIRCLVHTKSLKFIDYQANGSLKCLDTLRASTFSIACFEGGGSVDLIIKAQDFYTSLNSGVSEVHVSGLCQNSFLYSGSSTGIIYAQELKAGYTFCINQNTGNFYVFSQDLLEAEIKHSGSVYFKGNPSIIRNGSGKGELKSY